MIRVSNVRIPQHLCDIRCDSCGYSRQNVNVNTEFSYGIADIFGELVGHGDGINDQFQLEKTSYVQVDSHMRVYVQGELKTRGVDYNATSAGVITFTTPPPAGYVIQADYVWAGSKDTIRVPCGGCTDVSFYPTEGGGPVSQQLAQAKTA